MKNDPSLYTVIYPFSFHVVIALRANRNDTFNLSVLKFEFFTQLTVFC